MGFLAMILGPLMRMLYQMIPNFAVTMIVFTVIIKLLMLPLMIKQQKSMAKMSVFTPMINEIQQKYKNNQEKMQEEMVKFQQEYGYSPTAGCLPMLVNMLVLFGMVEVVYRPVQYILGIPKEAISAACTALGIANNGAASQTGLIEAIHAGLANGVDTGLTTEQLSSIANFNTSFLGMDMCTIPGFSFSLIMIFPIIAAVTMCIPGAQHQDVRPAGPDAGQHEGHDVGHEHHVRLHVLPDACRLLPVLRHLQHLHDAADRADLQGV